MISEYITSDFPMHRISISLLLFCVLNVVKPADRVGPLLFETVSGTGIELNSRIYTFVQDSGGYIWFGTDYGLLRFDGYRTIRVSVSEPEYSTLLGSVGVQALALTLRNSLWVGTRQGVLHLDLDTWEVKSPQMFRGLIIRKLLAVNDTLVWVGTEQGLYNYNPVKDEAVYYNPVNSRLSQNIIETLYMDQSGNLWVGTADYLNVLRKDTQKFESFDLKGDYKPDISHNLILDIQPLSRTHDSILLVGTETGLCIFNRFSGEYLTYNEVNCDLTNEVVKTIYARDPTEVFFGTDLGFNKLNLITGEVEKFFHNPFNHYSIINNEVWNIGPDKEGNLWLTTSNGVSRLDMAHPLFVYTPIYFQDQENLIGTRVADVIQDEEGRLWVATSDGLLQESGASDARLEFSRVPGTSSLSIDNINTISMDRFGRIWIGSVAGINVWDPSEDKIRVPPMDDGSRARVASNYISALLQGKEDMVWIGTWGGGLYQAGVDVEGIDEIDISYVGDFNGMMVRGKDHLWSLYGKILNRFSFITHKVEVISELNDFAGDDVINCLCYSNQHRLWIGSKNQLISYDIENNEFDRVRMPIEEDFIIVGLIEDQKGNIWGCSSNTIFSFDPESQVFDYYPLPESIPLKKLILSPFRTTGEEDIIVCGFDGFLRFNPSEFADNASNKEILITSLWVNGEPLLPHVSVSGKAVLSQVISKEKRVVLPYSRRNLDFEFSSFQYNNTKHEQYAYMLEGYENEWKITEPGDNTSMYVNLPPGKYIFKVKDYSGDISSRATELSIRIKLPVWASPPLLSFYILLLLAIVGIIYYQYRNRLKYRTQVDAIQIEKEQIEKLNASKIRFFVNISHELLTSIGLVIDPVKQLLSNKDLDSQVRSTLKMIARNANFLRAYVDQLLNFRKIELGHEVKRIEEDLELISFCKEVVNSFKGKAISKGVSVKLKSEVKKMVIDTDEEKLYSILQNLLSNAIKFTPQGGHVTVSVRVPSSGPY